MELLLVIGIVIVYFIPSLIAWQRGHKHKNGICLLNLFLGWTILGWIGALIWSVCD